MLLAHASEARARASENDSRVGRIVRLSPLDWRGPEMTDDPIALDGRRSTAGQRVPEMRRRAPSSRAPHTLPRQAHLERLEDQALAERARTWAEVLKKGGCYSTATREV